MGYLDESYMCSPSTKYEWKKVRISAHPQGTGTGGGTPSSRGRRRRRDWWGRDQIVIAYRGGPENSYLITYRSHSWRYAGHLDLHDVMTDLARRWA